MNKFGGSSTARLVNLHPDLQILACDCILHLDISILATTRGKKEQTDAYNKGYSQARFAESPHNYQKSLALDVGLWDSEFGGVDYTDKEAFKKVVECFKFHAEARGISITAGYDWGGFQDMPHLELTNWRVLAIDLPLVD